MVSREVLSSIQQNIAVHNRIARKYEAVHDEIFNDIEQLRLRSVLQRAINEVQTGRVPIEALDVGCGSGNLTGHLVALGTTVTAADVAAGFLDLVRDRFPGEHVKTHELNGRDFGGLADRSFDLVATYSVLHHIPDYLAAVAEMARVCRPGGVIVIDHEASPNVWRNDHELEQFHREARRLDWRKYLTPSNYLHRVWRFFDSRHSNEGDIHVWPDDHIEWDKIISTMGDCGCAPILHEDYLLYRKLYRPEVYNRFKSRCTDMRVMIFRRVLAAG